MLSGLHLAGTGRRSRLALFVGKSRCGEGIWGTGSSEACLLVVESRD